MGLPVNILPIAGKIQFDTDASAFIVAANITDATQRKAITKLVIDLKGYGIWSKMKAIYPFVGGTATTHKYNLVNPLDTNAAFRLTFTGGWTHSSTGATPNGTNAYADTFLVPYNKLTLYNTHISVYSRTNTNTGGGCDIGGQWEGLGGLTYTLYQVNGNSSNNCIGSISTADANRVIYTQANPASHVITSRTANNSLKSYTNGVLKATNTTINTSSYNGLPQNNTYLSALNYSPIVAYSNKENAFTSIGDGLTDTDAANLYTAVQAYQTTLGRNV